MGKNIQVVSELGKRFSDVTILLHEAIARNAGLSGTDHKYLNILIKGGAMSAGDLAKYADLSTGAVTGVIDRLEKHGLVKRKFVKDDRRKVIIVPVAENIYKVLRPSFKLLKAKVTMLVNTFTGQERVVIEKYLRNVIHVMEEVTSKLSEHEK